MSATTKLDRILILDVETTGLDRERDRAVEVAAVLLDVATALPLAAHATLLPLPEGMSNAAREINGIPDELLRELAARSYVGRSEYDGRWDPVIDMAAGADAFLAHRASFDHAFVPPALARLAPWICSKFGCEWPRGRWSDHLVGLALAHGEAVTAAHRALDDAWLLARVLRRVGDMKDLSDHLGEGTILRNVLANGLERGVGECPKCPEPGCQAYVRTYREGYDGLACPRHLSHRLKESRGANEWFL